MLNKIVIIIHDNPIGTEHFALHLAGDLVKEIHLLVKDVIMPEMNGRDLPERLRESRPGMKCFFMSECTANIIANQSRVDEEIDFIQKPFSRKDLALKVRQAISNGLVAD